MLDGSGSPAVRAEVGIRGGRIVEVNSGLEYTWQTMGEFLARHPATGVNVCQLVGHGALRCAVMGIDDRPPTSQELERMRALLAKGTEAGAFGLSTGLAGPPSSYAELDELVALAEVAARAGGGYFTHMRNEGAEVVQAIREALEIGRRARSSVQISHLKISNPGHWGIAGDLLKLIDQAREEGVRVHGDQYPYTASSGGLRARLPRWAQAGGREAILARLRDPMLDLLLADGLATRGIYFHLGETDLRRILCDPHVAIGSDGLFMGRPGEPDRTNPLRRAPSLPAGHPHGARQRHRRHAPGSGDRRHARPGGAAQRPAGRAAMSARASMLVRAGLSPEGVGSS